MAELSDVVAIARDLIRIDTSNSGAGRAEPEGPAADLVAALLAEVGLAGERYDAAPGRANLVVRWPGRDRDAPAVLLHAHLDVVPADPARWTVPPFGGVVRDGMLWGRGAVDMKNMAAMIVAAVRAMMRRGEQPERDVVLAFFADEEAGSTLGAQWLVDAHPELFAGVGSALGEGGGYSVAVGDGRAYLMNTGEKGLLWVRLTATGAAGHGALPARDNAILTLARAIGRVGDLVWPTELTPTTRELLDALRALLGAGDDADPLALADAVGASAARVKAGMRNVVNVTMFDAGYKENVVPEEATALLDVRFLPGQRDAVLARIREALGPDVRVDVEMDLPSIESPFSGELVDALRAAIGEHDAGAAVLPHLIPGGTDARALARLGIAGYGFAPLRLPRDFDFPAMFHGVDERVPLEALEFGQRVLESTIRGFGRVGADLSAPADEPGAAWPAR